MPLVIYLTVELRLDQSWAEPIPDAVTDLEYLRRILAETIHDKLETMRLPEHVMIQVEANDGKRIIYPIQGWPPPDYYKPMEIE